MKFGLLSKIALLISFFTLSNNGFAQTLVKGKIIDAGTSEVLVGATVVIKGTTIGAQTDYDGLFSFQSPQKPPFTLLVSFVGFETKEMEVTDVSSPLSIKLGSEALSIETVEIKGQRISDKQKAAPLTVESMDRLAIKQTAAVSFYEGLGALKGVDMTTASIGFTIINTRGFNSTSPVRSLQIIDGVDNQSPGLNFSLGNFLGSSELDVLKVDLVQGASSAFYGPNAFNGVISMETKNPFFQRGLAASVKAGERNLVEVALRFAESYKNKAGHDWFAFKINGSFMKAYDWVADNYDPVFDTESGKNNPGRFDAVNIYGDEFNATFDQRPIGKFPINNVGLGLYHRTGYREIDLVDYNTRNTKANLALHFRLNPSEQEQSTELILSSSYGAGTTVYQGDNRFSLRNIQFFQNRFELRKRDKFFLRFYATNEDAGDSYDPYFSALLLLDTAKNNVQWGADYGKRWQDRFDPLARELGYPRIAISFDPITGLPVFSFDSTRAQTWLQNPVYQDSLASWHRQAAEIANGKTIAGTSDFFEPGTDRFQSAFDAIRTRLSGSRRGAGAGSRFFDRSALYHGHGEYRFAPRFADEIVVGANGRLYTPNSRGTIFSDTNNRSISVFEYGVYAGIQKSISDKKVKFNATLRMDKNQNFNYLFSPAASVVYQPDKTNFLRLSFSSAIRNPTLTDQYLLLNVGPAILSGNISGVKDLITLESFRNFLSTQNSDTLRRISIAPIRPEKVRSVEIGYRTTLWDNTFIDGSYYFSSYSDFIGFQIGLRSDFIAGVPVNTQGYRYSANSSNTVTTQGFSVGFSHYFKKYYQFSGNYSWNRLNTKVDDPIIPAFNTPEHKFNVSVSGRDVPLGEMKNVGFNLNYKWVEGFIFQGSPQFTGFIPSYGLLDGQVNWLWQKANVTFKLGASNILNNKQFQTYGGPRIGRMAYFTIVYDFVKK